MITALLLTLAPQHAGLATEEASSPTIHYVVDFADARNHYISVEMTAPAIGNETRLMMAVWTPGSYLLREYARHIDSLEFFDANGKPLVASKTHKNRWTVATGSVDEITVRYRLYCNEMSVRTNWVGADFAVLNGASTFLTVADRMDLAHTVELKLPPTWKRSATSLHSTGESPHHFRAKDFDELVDSPIVAGNLAVYPFEAGGVPHQLVNVGGSGYWDGQQAAADLQKIVQSQQTMWNVTPYDRYLFLNVISETRGGLEHDFSTLMMTSRWAFRDKKQYRDWLSLASHEFFHTWNVRRLRPRSLKKYDYESEVYTTSLWIAEGITSYFEDVLLARAGLIDHEEYLRRLSQNIKSVQTGHGRAKQSLTDASFDTWIKFYRPDENSSNTRTNYYRKGCVAAFLLDARIRHVTNGTKSLDDVMRRLYAEHLKTGYDPADFRRTATAIVGQDLSKWFTEVIDSTGELNYEEALDWWGLEFGSDTAESKLSKSAPTDPKADASTPKDPQRWLGFEGISPVRHVQSNSPATASGIHTGDEVLAINGFRVTKDNLEKRLKQYQIGDTVDLLLARRGKIITLNLTLRSKPKQDWSLKPIQTPTDQQRQNVTAWLGEEKTKSPN